MGQCQEIPNVEIVKDLFERVGLLSRGFSFSSNPLILAACRCLFMKKNKREKKLGAYI